MSPLRRVRRSAARGGGQQQRGAVDKQRSRVRVFSDEEWARIEPLLPSNEGRKGHPFGEHRKVVEGIVYRYRTGIPWRDLPREEYGP